MKITMDKDWFLRHVSLEEGQEIGAGCAPYIPEEANIPEGYISPKEQFRVLPSPNAEVAITSQHISFSKFVTLMRRRKQWSIKDLAIAADVDAEELLVIEHDLRHEPELSTVVELARVFQIPSSPLIKMAGLAEECSSVVREEGLKFAACSESKAPLTDDEEEALRTFLKVIVESSDQR